MPEYLHRGVVLRGTMPKPGRVSRVSRPGYSDQLISRVVLQDRRVVRVVANLAYRVVFAGFGLYTSALFGKKEWFIFAGFS